MASVVDLSLLTSTQGFIIQGDVAGYSVSSAGDVNGDGIADLIVGAPYGDDGGADVGEAYVIFGRDVAHGAAAFGTIDLSTLDPADGFVIQGDAAGDIMPSSVSAAGDVNGDGVGDLIVGTWHGDDGGTDAGEAYVIFTDVNGTVPTTALVNEVLQAIAYSNPSQDLPVGATENVTLAFTIDDGTGPGHRHGDAHPYRHRQRRRNHRYAG
ncbi:MAG: FG-GAP repeat protein [Hyphomicrobiaceae bacterium]|nr:FG-GAP repeat protein [Hyphomicrobiaceae bacterium]